mgnify:CR=1 FL=1
MAQIYRLDDSTLYLCDSCLKEFGPVPGKWFEDPQAACSVCGEIDLQTREELDEYHHHMSNLQWEMDTRAGFYGDDGGNAGRFGELDDEPNPYHGTHSED